MGFESDMVRASFDAGICSAGKRAEAEAMNPKKEEYSVPRLVPPSELSEDFKAQIERFPEGSPMREKYEKLLRGGEGKSGG